MQTRWCNLLHEIMMLNDLNYNYVYEAIMNK